MATAGGAINTPPSGPQSSQVQSAPNLVHFDPKQVVPSQPIYIQRNDLIAFQLISNAFPLTLRIDYRWLTPDGEIKEGEFNPPPISLTSFFSFPLYEGWLLSFAARNLSPFVAGQWAFMQAILVRSSTTVLLGPTQALIWQGYIPVNAVNGWPGTPSKEISDGAGTVRNVVGSFPAAGTEISEIMTTFTRRLLTGLSVILTTSATVANRTPSLIINDGANFIMQTTGYNLQPASTTQIYSFGPAIPSQAFVQGAITQGLPLPFPVKAGWKLLTSTLNLQAGDQWSSPKYSFIEWGLWDG